MVVDIRIPPTKTTEGLDTARVITRSCPTSASWCSPRTSKSAMRWQIGSRGLATSQSVYCPPPHGRPQTEARLPASVHRGRSGRGRRHDLSILQAEFSLTQMLDTPISGRIFLEQVIRDNLDIGRPDQVGLVFDARPIRRGARATPGRFRTRVITAGVTPSLHVDDKHTTIKQYGKAPRTKTTITDTNDFGIGKRPTNLPALREIGDTANRRLLGVQRIGHDPITGARCPAHRHRTRHHRDRHPHPRPAPGVSSAAMPAHRAAAVSAPTQRRRQQRSPPIDRRTAGSTTRHGHL